MLSTTEAIHCRGNFSGGQFAFLRLVCYLIHYQLGLIGLLVAYATNFEDTMRNPSFPNRNHILWYEGSS